MNATVFHSGATETILFDFWKIDCGLTMLVSVFVVVLLCSLKEFLRIYRDHLSSEAANSLANLMLFALQTFLGYSLMAIFMLLNIWLCAAVVIGEVLSNIIVSKLLKQRYEVFFL